MHPMVLLHDEAQVDGRFGPLRDSANRDTRLVHGLPQTYLGDMGHVKSRWVHLETMLLSV
jgi:hypothetical protein